MFISQSIMCVFILLSGLLASAEAADPSPEIRVGSELDFYPYAFVNAQGEADGFSVDLVKAVAGTMDLKLKIVAEPWDKVWNDLVAGRIDLLPLVGKLPERAAVIEFSKEHTGTPDAFFVRGNDPPIGELATATGKTIVVMRSDVAHHKLLETKFQGGIVTVGTITEGLQLVASGQHDAFLGPQLMAMLAIRDQKIPNVKSSGPVKDYMRIQAFAVKKGDFKLLETLNKGLDIVKSSGEYERIYNKWLVVELPTQTRSSYPFAIPIFVGLAIAVTLAFLFRKFSSKPR